MKSRSTTSFVVSTISLLTGFASIVASASAQENGKQAKLGDPAPALQVAEWVQGGPIDLKEGMGEKIYVIEFWATWCPPCRASIPHLSGLNTKFKNKRVVIIGVSSETPDDVKPFIKKQGDKMNYAVAIDKDRQTDRAYMTAFGQNGIPHAFIVDTEGRIVWHGHPMDNLEQEIEKYLPKAPKEAKSKACGCCSNKVLPARYAKAYRVIVTTGLDEKKQPINDLKHVSLDESKVYFDVRWNLAKREHDLAWRLYDGAGRLACKSEFTFKPCCSGCPCTHTWHSYNLNKNVDKPGVWRFQLYLDGRRKVSKRFTVSSAYRK